MGSKASVRNPQFAGSFYSEDENELHDYLERILRDHVAPTGDTLSVQGCFVPHAGYIYSAECAAKTLALIDIPDNVILLHTKHTRQGNPLAVSHFDFWRTPLGMVPNAPELAQVLTRLGPAVADTEAEEGEHAGEVILPFLQMLNKDVRVCVVSIAHMPIEAIHQLGHAVAQAASPTDTLIVASTDMHHYSSRRETERLDDMALEQMEALDPDGLIDVVNRNRISMCGAAATAAMMHACIELGAKELVVVDHRDSGDTNGDYEHVVGYASGYVR